MKEYDAKAIRAVIRTFGFIAIEILSFFLPQIIFGADWNVLYYISFSNSADVKLKETISQFATKLGLMEESIVTWARERFFGTIAIILILLIDMLK